MEPRTSHLCVMCHIWGPVWLACSFGPAVLWVWFPAGNGWLEQEPDASQAAPSVSGELPGDHWISVSKGDCFLHCLLQSLDFVSEALIQFLGVNRGQGVTIWVRSLQSGYQSWWEALNAPGERQSTAGDTRASEGALDLRQPCTCFFYS